MEDTKKPRTSREESFVHGIIARCHQNKGLAARLRRADNPATEYQSWELLAAYGIDLERTYQRLPFVTVAAAIARAKIETNGKLPLGRALARCYKEGRAPQTDDASDPIRVRLRRLLACSELPELCRVLRPILTLIESRVNQPLDYVRLLRQLRSFSFDDQRIKAQWAQEFYGARARTDEEEAA